MLDPVNTQLLISDYLTEADLMDPINVELIMKSNTGGSWVRVIDQESVFAYGPDWALLIHKGVEPNLTNLLLQMQVTGDTVFHIGVLSTTWDNVVNGANSNTFKINGQMTSQTLAYEDPTWNVFYNQALEQVHYTTRPGSYISLDAISTRGKSKAHYAERKTDTRRFSEQGVPCPDWVEYVIDVHNREPILLAIRGRILRFAQNMNISLEVPSVPPLIDVLELPVGNGMLPWLIGSSGNSWMMVRPLADVDTQYTNRLYHTNEMRACWGTVELAQNILIRSKTIYSSMEVLQSLYGGNCLCELDLNLEARNLNLRNYYHQFIPELFAIDILRYQGWNTGDIQSWIAANYEEAWLTQAKCIAEDFLAIQVGEPAVLAKMHSKGRDEFEYLVKLCSFTQNQEVHQITGYVAETYSEFI